MRSYSWSATLADPPSTIPAWLDQRLQRDPQGPMVALRSADAVTWHELSTEQALATVAALGRGLIALGVAAGDRIAILGRTSWDWTRVDLALCSIGAVTVPIYETDSAEQIAWIATDSGFTGVVVENDRLRAGVVEALGEAAVAALPVGLWTMSEGGLAEIERLGRSVELAEFVQRRAEIDGTDLATIIYTSGTTGRPKGVELTHSNIAVSAAHTATELHWICGPGSRLLQFLPLAHSFARQINFIALGASTVTAFTPSASNLMADLRSFRPTFMLVVPRVLEKVYNSAEQSTGGGLKLKLFRWAAKVAIVSSRELDSRGGLTKIRRLQYEICQLLVYRRLTATLGEKLTMAVSGGAPLGERLAHFFRGIGLTIYEGYGLTETTAPTAVNRRDRNKIGSVGPPLPSMTVAVADDGEILVKGSHVFKAYHNDLTATAESFTDDGWFKTGDIGLIDGDGYVTITGRRKELIVTAGGKNVAPALLEDRLRGHPLVSQCVVVGDQRPFIGVLITLDQEMLPGWLSNHGKSALTPEQALIDPDVHRSLERAIDRANSVVSRAESIRAFRLLPGDFSEANGYLTPSLKVKRNLVLRDYAAAVDALYDEAARRKSRQ